MKKILLGTSALVLLAGAAAAQQVTTKAPFTVTLGGSVRSDFIIVNDELANQESREARLDYRLHVKAEAKAENGLTYGFNARLRNNQISSGVNPGQTNQDTLGADRKFVYMSGSWGQIQLGDTVTPATTFEVQAPTVGLGQADFAFGTSVGNYSFYHFNEDSYDTKAVYYTPVFAGFQAGVSYTPEKGSRGRDNARSKFVTGSGNDYSDLVGLGAAYTGKFGDIGLKAAAGVDFGDQKDTSATSKSTKGDYVVWNLGAQVSYQGFTVGGHYFNNGETGLSKGDDRFGWQVGLTYAVGPWGVGVNYARVETDPAARGSKSTTDYMVGLGGAYQLAPGLSLQADIVQFEAESQTGGLKAGQTKNDGTLFTFRTRLDF